MNVKIIIMREKDTKAYMSYDFSMKCKLTYSDKIMLVVAGKQR